MATPTRSFSSPPYTGPSADALITTAAGYRQDREAILDLAAAGTSSPDDLNSTAVARLAAAVGTLDTLVIAADTERSADLRTIARLERDLAIERNLRIAALQDAYDHMQRCVRLSAENARLRIQAGINQLALTISGRSAAELSAELALEQLAEREHARAMLANILRTGAHRSSMVLGSYDADTLVIDASEVAP